MTGRVCARPNLSAGNVWTARGNPALWKWMFSALMTVVCLITTLLTMRGPPQPAQRGWPRRSGRPHHGSTGSPQESATHHSPGRPKLMLADTSWPRIMNATRAGEYTERRTTGPGAHAQKPSINTQRP